MSVKIDISKFRELVSIQKERQLAMQALSESIGVDISFSDEEVVKFATEEYEKLIEQKINKEVEMWMKSLLS